MERKLKCAIVDNDPESHKTIIGFLRDSSIGEITHSFYTPSELLEKMKGINFDVVFLDVLFKNDTIQGFDIAPILNAENKAIIFIASNNEHIIEACRYAGAIDVAPKPHSKSKLISSLIKATKIMNQTSTLINKEYELFYVAERREQVRLCLSDILFAKTSRDPRNKEVVLKKGEHFTLMNCPFNYLLKLSPKLVQINISQLVSYDIVESVFHDAINLKTDITKEVPRILTLSATYRSQFKNNIK